MLLNWSCRKHCVEMILTQRLIAYNVIWEGVVEGEGYEDTLLVVDVQLLCLKRKYMNNFAADQSLPQSSKRIEGIQTQ